jgi:putative NADH-flavin reductase
MTLTIFGATGMVGQQLVQQALHMGHVVKAFGRNVFTSHFPENKNLQLIQGALFDEKEVLNAITGSDAVLSVLGGPVDGADKTRSLGMKNIVTQMGIAGLKRIVAVGGMGVLNAPDGGFLLDKESYPPQFLSVGREHLKAYEFLKSSSLDWTFVCPPDIINADVTGEFQTASDTPPEINNYKINSGDLTLFMLNELQKKEYIQKRVGISN